MKLIETNITVGAVEPFELLHISDTHLTLADDRDDERKLKLAEERAKYFPHAEEYLAEAEEYAAERDMTIVHTGDLIDFVSEANLDRAREFCENNDVFFAAGNHEFSLYVGEAFEDEAYKMQSFALVQSFCGNDLRFASRVMHGVNFVALDNVYYDFTARQLEQLKAEVARGLPIVLMMHTPLYTQALCAHAMEELHQPCAYLVGAPEECLAAYPPDRRVQQQPTRDTLAMIDYIQSQPQIRAILAGHLHYNYEGPLPCGTMQYVTGGGFQNCAREITFV